MNIWHASARSLGRWHLVFGPSTRLPLTYVENCADCFAQAVENPRAVGETFNVVDGHEIGAWHYLGEYHPPHTGRASIASRSPTVWP